MGVKTAASVIRENAGSNNLLLVKFTDIDTGDTYVSGLSSVIGFWANKTDTADAAGNEGIAVSESSGTFTFRTGESNNAVTLYILVKD